MKKLGVRQCVKYATFCIKIGGNKSIYMNVSIYIHKKSLEVFIGILK